MSERLWTPKGCRVIFLGRCGSFSAQVSKDPTLAVMEQKVRRLSLAPLATLILAGEGGHCSTGEG